MVGWRLGRSPGLIGARIGADFQGLAFLLLDRFLGSQIVRVT
jgi:hypothetical protein